MAVALRFQRIGKPKHAFYRMVAIDTHKRRDGSPLEVLGNYDPFKLADKLVVNTDRIKFWISKGATCSDTVRNLLKNQQLWEKVH